MKKTLLILILSFFVTLNLAGQGLNLPTKHFGISFGNSVEFTGLRFNFSDNNLEEINGINITLWRPENEGKGTVNGLGFGLVGSGGARLNGFFFGLIGNQFTEQLNGVSIAGLGMGGGSLNGIGIASLGVGVDQSIWGITFGGLGVGAGENITGFSFGGLGVGAGGSITGLSFGGLGVGAGQDITGITIGGIGVGAGGSVNGLAFGILGVGSPELNGIMLAGGSVSLASGGMMRGFSVSAANLIRGEQKGITIGLYNYARKLNGIQIGVINYARNNPPLLRVLPLVNMHFGD